jgi:FKBP-type peptidyl-prolyl cis-trans isomerase
MRNLTILGALFLFLVVIAFIARSGFISRKNPGDPMNKYMRETMDTPQTPQLSTEESAVIIKEYNTATLQPSGLRYVMRRPGTGDATPHSGQQVTVNYVGRLLLSGKKFDSSYDRHKPFTFMTGVGRVIPGWDIMIQQMKRGEKRTVIIPWWLAYGAAGRPPVIPPKASLVFDIELLDFH